MKIELVFNIQEAVSNTPSEQSGVLAILLLINIPVALMNSIACLDIIDNKSIDKYILLKLSVFYNLYRICRKNDINKIGSLIIAISAGIITIPASIFSICFYILLALCHGSYIMFKEFFKDKKED